MLGRPWVFSARNARRHARVACADPSALRWGSVEPAPPTFLYRDEALVVVDKPAGLLCHRSELAPDRDVVMIRVRDALGAYVYPVHRLDRGTSGALLFALSSEVASALRTAFDEGRVKKRYVAIARGVVPEAVRVDYAIPKAEGSKERVPAVTSVRRLAAGDHVSLVECFPETGRYHQIRRHLAHLRHPLALDANYGTGWFNRHVRDTTGLTRLALHAAGLAFEHPVTGAPLSIEAPLPDDLRRALEVLGLTGA